MLKAVEEAERLRFGDWLNLRLRRRDRVVESEKGLVSGIADRDYFYFRHVELDVVEEYSVSLIQNVDGCILGNKVI
jgi:hypothetical protein